MSGITYHWEGDYLIPDITLPEQPDRPIGKYGKMRRTYLKEHRNGLFTTLSLQGELFPHLLEIDEAAAGRLQLLMKELLEKNPTPDKATDQMEWVAHMNSLKAQAEEVILTELIYS